MDKPSQYSPSAKSTKPLSEGLSTLNLLRPAGTQLLLEEEETTFFDYMRLTFSDLILKRVMEVEIVRRKAHPRDKRIQSYYMIKIGSNFHFYNPTPYQKIFLNELNLQYPVLLKTFIENVFNESPRDKPYKKRLVKELELKQYFKTGLAFHLFRQLRLNNQGIAFKLEVQSYIQKVDHELIGWLKNDPSKVIEALSVLGGNIFLLPRLNKKLWNNICYVANEFENHAEINLITSTDLQELTSSYFTPDIYPIISYFYDRVEQLVGYNGVLSGVNNSSDYSANGIF